jgi:uncharacterized protein
MGRIFLWLVVGVVAWWLLRSKRRTTPSDVPRARTPTGGAPEAMVDCAACGLHFPASEAVRDGARLYCCSAHRDTGPRRDE